MNTLILTANPADVRRAGGIIASGGLVAFPTETVYGLGANALDPEAVAKVYKAKGRPSDNPMIVHIAFPDGLSELTENVTRDMMKLMTAFWPGPLTMVVPRKPIVPDVTTGGLDTVGVRLPESETARLLIAASGCPIAAPSANLSGKPSPTRAEDVIADMDGRIDAIIAGSPARCGIESTVVDMTGEIPVILRPGVITREMLSDVLGKPVEVDPAVAGNVARADTGASSDADASGKAGTGLKDAAVPRAPGMKYKHYAPDAEMKVFAGDPRAVRAAMEKERLELEQAGRRVRTLVYDDAGKAAANFYTDLRCCDAEGVDVILAAALVTEGVGFSVMDRMVRSCGGNIVRVGDADPAENKAYNNGGKKMIAALAADHAGYELKNAVKEHLKERGYKIVDLGTNGPESVDYPAYGKACGEAVASGKADLGVVCCGSGIGISIAANKVKGVRCALCTSEEMGKLCKEHNNANMIALGGRLTDKDLALRIVDAWLDAEFMGGKHQRRIDQLDEI